MTEIGYFFITGKSGIRLQFIFNRLVFHSHKTRRLSGCLRRNGSFSASLFRLKRSFCPDAARFSGARRKKIPTKLHADARNLAGKREEAQKVFPPIRPTNELGRDLHSLMTKEPW